MWWDGTDTIGQLVWTHVAPGGIIYIAPGDIMTTDRLLLIKLTLKKTLKEAVKTYLCESACFIGEDVLYLSELLV